MNMQHFEVDYDAEDRVSIAILGALGAVVLILALIGFAHSFTQPPKPEVARLCAVTGAFHLHGDVYVDPEDWAESGMDLYYPCKLQPQEQDV